ncbi:MAG: hypothetical protein JRH20_05275 [Deltaproteobacteria bacterium]|nr:hypothetical protein [Deltaproteobacteria bacterium]
MIKKLAPALGVVASLGLLFGCQDLKPIKGKGRAGATTAESGGTGGSMGVTGTTGPKVSVEMYVMSKCPYGVKAVDGFTPVLKELGDRIDFKLEYIATELGAGKFKSLHGQPEVDGNIQQLCARKHYPALSQWVPFIDCVNKTWRTIPKNWEACAKKTQLDVAKLKGCIDGEEGKQLQTASAKAAKARKASGSPTIYVAGKSYRGGRGKNEFMRAICSDMKGTKPEACKKIPEPIEVKAIVLNDKRCKKCQTASLESNLRGRFFPKLTIRTIDYNTPEGKKLYQELKLKHLPAWLFEKGVEKSDKYARIARWMEPKGEYKKLKVPAKFDPTAEICDNKADDTGNGKVDCDDPTCKGDMLCREEKKKQLNVFVMSQCPFGVKAIDAMKEVLENFGTDLDFDVHYIATKDPKQKSGFKALHGDNEVYENMRQLCAKKYYKRGNKYLNYLWCRSKNYRSNEWKGCAKDGISAAVIEKCMNSGEGAKLHGEDIKIGQQLGVSGSPTWLANNRFKFSGIAPNDIKKNVCKHNAGMKNCDKQLTQKAAVKGKCN